MKLCTANNFQRKYKELLFLYTVRTEDIMFPKLCVCRPLALADEVNSKGAEREADGIVVQKGGIVENAA